MLWCILALPEGSERNTCFPWVKFSEVSQSLNYFSALGATKLFRKLLKMFQKLLLEGRLIHGNCLINMKMSTLMSF